MPYSKYRRFLAKAIINGLRREAARELRQEKKISVAVSQISQKAESLLNQPSSFRQVLPRVWEVCEKRSYLIVDLNAIAGSGSCKCWLFREAGVCQHLSAVKSIAENAAYFAFWSKSYWQVWNLDDKKNPSLEHYTVTRNECDCGDWVFRCSKNGAKCKHQKWFYPEVFKKKSKRLTSSLDKPKAVEQEQTEKFSESLKFSESFPSWPSINNKETSVDLSRLPRGMSGRKTDEWMMNEFLIYALTVCQGSEKEVCIGRLYDSSVGIQACLPRGSSSFFSSTRQAAVYLLKAYGLKLEEVEKAAELAEF